MTYAANYTRQTLYIVKAESIDDTNGMTWEAIMVFLS